MDLRLTMLVYSSQLVYLPKRLVRVSLEFEMRIFAQNSRQVIGHITHWLTWVEPDWR